MEKIKNREICISCEIDLRENIAKIIFLCDIPEDYMYEIDDLIKNLYADLMPILFAGENSYVVRVYGRYYHASTIDLNGTFKWKNNVTLTAYEVKGRDAMYSVDDGLAVSPKEQILYCDIEVNAFNLSAARSLAYNAFLEFIALLSVLLDIDIEPLTSKENILTTYEQLSENQYSLVGSVASNGFYDEELEIFVYDNMNGLIVFDEYGQMCTNNYTFISANGIAITQSSYNENLEKKFKDRELHKIKKQYKQASISEEIVHYNSHVEIVSECAKFFKKIVSYEKENEKGYRCFCNACKLYNYAQYAGYRSPSVMIAYWVASVEALGKVESNAEYQKVCSSDMDKFVSFCKKYYTEDFDEIFMKYLYGKIRSGHFHSGEFSFLEYNCSLDLSFERNFFELQNIYMRARSSLRKVFLLWIRKNVLE